MTEDYRIAGLFKQYKDELISYMCRKYGRNIAEAEDLLQIMFERLCRPNVNENINRAYLYQMANNLVIDKIRKDKGIDRTRNNFMEVTSSTQTISPEQEADSQQQLNKILQAIDDMPLEQSKCFIMHRIQNLSYTEIARRVGISESAVRKRVRKTLNDCQQALEK